MKIAKIMPIAAVVFTLEADKGISMTEATRQKEALKNKNNPRLRKLKGDLYVIKREILSQNGVHTEHTKLTDRIQLADFECLEEIADDNAKAAWLGQAVKLIDMLRMRIVAIQPQELAELFELKIPVLPPLAQMVLPKQATSLNIDAYCALDDAEELFRKANAELLEKCGALLQDALHFEAKASVYGKQIHPESFLRDLANAKDSVPSPEINNGSIIVFNTKMLAYDKSQFADLDVELQGRYSELQQQRNRIFKIVKDTARELALKYQEEYRVAMAQRDEIMRAYNMENDAFNNAIAKLKLELHAELAACKILG